MIKDRGNIKWTSLMLTEHRKGLEELFKHEDDVEMPVLDEQKIEELERTLQEAIRNNKIVEITYYNNRRHHNIRGKIQLSKDKSSIIISEKRIPLKRLIDIKTLF